MKTGLYRENGHVDFVQFDGKLVCCSWCGDEPTHRALWPGYQYGELVCLDHAIEQQLVVFEETEQWVQEEE